MYRLSARNAFFEGFLARHRNCVTVHVSAEGSHGKMAEGGNMGNAEGAGDPERLKARALGEARGADVVVVGTWVGGYYEVRPSDMHPATRAVIEECIRAGRNLVVVAFSSPYPLRSWPRIPAYLCAYVRATNCLDSVAAVLDVLFGDLKPEGRLPVTVIDGKYEAGHGMHTL